MVVQDLNCLITERLKIMKMNVTLTVIVALVMFAGVGNLSGAVVVTTDDIRSFMNQAGNTSCRYTTLDGFTVDGVAHDNVWAIILSEIYYEVDGEEVSELVPNGYGRSVSGGNGFRFYMFGSSENPLVSASQIIMIINDDNPELFEIGNDDGLVVGLGEDRAFGWEMLSVNKHLSIDGGEFGDISSIFYSYESLGDHSLGSVVLSTAITGIVPGDTNGDEVVDALDYANLVAQFGGAPGVESADFNDDGFVDLEDFVIMRGNIGFGGAPIPDSGSLDVTPEPCTMVLFCCGCAVLLPRRGRKKKVDGM